MIGGLVRRLIDAVSRDRIDTLSEEMEELRQEVLSNEERIGSLDDRVSSRLDDLESWRKERDEHIDSNARAVEHVVEALTHQVESGEEGADTAIPDEVAAYLTHLEERVETLENAYRSQKTPEEASGRPSKRPVDEDGRPTSLADTAEDAKVGESLWEKATPAQRSVLQAMYDAGYPMSYKELAEEMGRSVSTVKNHINNLKAAGYDFKEDAGHNNAKKYMLDDRVKAFLTLRLNQ